jgi:hypothetical protein
VLRREHDRVIESDDIDDQSLQFYPMKLLLQTFDLSNGDVGGSIFDEINRLGVDRLLWFFCKATALLLQEQCFGLSLSKIQQ